MKVHERFIAAKKAMSEIGIAKASKNNQQGYAYRGIDDVLNTLAPILAENGLIILPSVVNSSYTTLTTRSGGTAYHHQVETEYTIIGAEGDSIGPFKGKGECIDSSDKGLNKACSAAFKYWVLTSFCVPIEGHGDADADTPEAAVHTISEPQLLELESIYDMLWEENAKRFMAWMKSKNVSSLSDTPATAFPTVSKALKKIYSDQYAEEQAQTQLAIDAEAKQ